MELSRFFNSIAGDRRYLAEDWAAYFASFIGNGVFPVPSSGLQVIAGDVGTSVILRAGRAWINGYFYTNEAELTMPLPIADGILPRIDRIVIRWSLTERRLYADVKQGTPASVPQPPPLQRDADIWELGLADIRVNAGATVITQANITDTRWNTALCGVVVGVVQQIDPTFITAQFDAFFAEYHVNVKNLFEQYNALVTSEYAQFSSDLANFFSLFQQNTQSQFSLFMSLVQGFTTDSQAAYQNFLIWLNTFQTQSSAAFNTWFESIQGILDEEAAGHILLLIQELQTFAPTEVIGTITHDLGRYPLCTLHKVDRAAGIGGAGEGGAGGGNLFTVPAEFEINGFNSVTIKTTAAYKTCTQAYQISDTEYGFADPDPANLTSLFLIIR